MIGDKIMKKIIKKENGFSLIELLVSVAIFSVLIVIIMSIFQSSIKAQHNATAAQNVQESMRFALELMSKEIRSAKQVYDKNTLTDDCIGSESYDGYAIGKKVYNVYDGSGASEGRVFYFKNKNNECVYYFVRADRLYINRGGTELPISPDELKVYNFDVSIIDDEINQFHGIQPRMTMTMTIEMNDPTDKNKMILQTTISSRYYE
jgi:prepilin-type N-terminal cleavage/methylation domain-containing protein